MKPLALDLSSLPNSKAQPCIDELTVVGFEAFLRAALTMGLMSGSYFSYSKLAWRAESGIYLDPLIT